MLLLAGKPTYDAVRFCALSSPALGRFAQWLVTGSARPAWPTLLTLPLEQ